MPLSRFRIRPIFERIKKIYTHQQNLRAYLNAGMPVISWPKMSK